MVHTLSPVPSQLCEGGGTIPILQASKLSMREGEEIAQGVMLAYLLSSSGGSELPLCRCLF